MSLESDQLVLASREQIQDVGMQAVGICFDTDFRVAGRAIDLDYTHAVTYSAEPGTTVQLLLGRPMHSLIIRESVLLNAERGWFMDVEYRIIDRAFRKKEKYKEASLKTTYREVDSVQNRQNNLMATSAVNPSYDIVTDPKARGTIVDGNVTMKGFKRQLAKPPQFTTEHYLRLKRLLYQYDASNVLLAGIVEGGPDS